MSWVAVGVGVVSVVGGAVSQNNAAKKGAKATNDATAATVGEQRRQYDQTREDQLPWLQNGAWALDQQKNFLSGDWSGFQNSPDYKFAVEQGFKGLDRGQAASLGFNSGGADADRIALGQGLATQYANNYWAKLAGLSGTGQNAAQSIGGFGQGAANAIGQANALNAQARTSSYNQIGQNNADMWQGLGQFANYGYQNRNAGR